MSIVLVMQGEEGLIKVQSWKNLS